MGLDKLLRDWGWEGFRLDWLIDPDRVVYCLVIAAVWQASGFIMAMFLAGLRGVDQSIVRAAQIDGASLPRIYWSVVLPSLRPVFFSAVMILAHIAIKSFDLVAAMTPAARATRPTCLRCLCTRSPSAVARWAWVRPVPS